MSRYLQNTVAKLNNPPQSEPLNERQVANSAGGYSFAVDCWKKLDRFLVLGSEGGSYYATERELTKDNLAAVQECIKLDGPRAVARIVEISDQGRAPKNDPALLALACAAASGELRTRSAALEALPRVARIGTHLFHFVQFVQEFRGWGRGLKTAISDWYLGQSIDRLSEQLTKYQQRDGMSHRDLLRLCHVEFPDAVRNVMARWVLDIDPNAGRELKDKSGDVARRYSAIDAKLPAKIEGHIRLQACKDAKEAAGLIREYGLVRESVPTELLTSTEVWDALLEKMPMTALIRNLGNLSKNGVLRPLGDNVRDICARITDPNALQKARIHPVQILMAARTYAAGHGMRGKGEWQVVQPIVDALDEAFYTAFRFVEPANKRFYLGLDISGSMWGGEVAGIQGFTPAHASGAMAMVTIRTEPQFYAAGFTTGAGRSMHRGYGSTMTPCNLSARMNLAGADQEMRRLSRDMGGTDCAQPMLDALEKKLDVDVFVIYTDSETWAGDVHPTKALEQYRQRTGIPAKLVVCGMVANDFSIADPNDAGMLDVVGFDSATPALIADFARE